MTIYDMKGKLISGKDDDVESEDDPSLLEGLVRQTLFHPFLEFRNTGLNRLKECNDIVEVGTILAGYVKYGHACIKIKTVNDTILEKLLFPVPKEVYEVKNPKSYPFII